MRVIPGKHGVEYRVGLSDSGLLVGIDVYDGGGLVSFVQIDRGAWPEVVRAVAEADAEERLSAQVDAIVAGAADAD